MNDGKGLHKKRSAYTAGTMVVRLKDRRPNRELWKDSKTSLWMHLDGQLPGAYRVGAASA